MVAGALLGVGAAGAVRAMGGRRLPWRELVALGAGSDLWGDVSVWPSTLTLASASTSTRSAQWMLTNWTNMSTPVVSAAETAAGPA